MMNEKNGIIDENVKIVTTLLIDNLLYCVDLIKVIKSSLKPPREYEHEDKDQRKLPGNDEEEEDNDDGEGKKSPQKENQPITMTATEKKSKNGTNKTNNTGSNPKKEPLGNSTNILTEETLFWHNVLYNH
jgi:hypothetical protein